MQCRDSLGACVEPALWEDPTVLCLHTKDGALLPAARFRGLRLCTCPFFSMLDAWWHESDDSECKLVAVCQRLDRRFFKDASTRSVLQGSNPRGCKAWYDQ